MTGRANVLEASDIFHEKLCVDIGASIAVFSFWLIF